MSVSRSPDLFHNGWLLTMNSLDSCLDPRVANGNIAMTSFLFSSCRVTVDSRYRTSDQLYRNKAYAVDGMDETELMEEKNQESSSLESLVETENEASLSLEGVLVDSTGLFHWCAGHPIDDVKLDWRVIVRSDDPNQTYRVAVNKHFRDHVVVCLISHQQSTGIGLCNFIMPLRSSNIEYDQLKDIVIVGDPDFISKEWTTLQNFPKLHILPGSPLNRAFLRAVNIKQCSACVILSAHDTISIDPTLTDKEPILCALNIKTMPRSRPEILPSPFHFGSNSGSYKGDVLGDNVPLLTELRHEANVQFLDQDDDPVVDEMFMSQPFATGRMFNISVLDSLISTTFFNPSALSFLQTLVTGGATSEVEQILAEGLGLLPGRSVEPTCLYRCCVCLLSVCKPPLFEFHEQVETVTFSQLFNHALTQHGIICLGLSRLIDPTSTFKHARRFVYTFPQKRTRLLKTDLAFCLRPLYWSNSQNGTMPRSHRRTRL